MIAITRILWPLILMKPWYFVRVSLLFFLENILEGFGLALIVPVFYKVLGTGGSGSSFAWLENIFLKLGLQPSIEILLLSMIGLFLIRGAIMYYSKKNIARSSSDILKELQEKLVHNYLHSKLIFFHNAKQGELINSVVSEASRASLSFLYLSQWISFAFSVALYVGLALYVSGKLTAVALFLGFLFFFPLRRITTECERIGSITTSLNGQLQTDLYESFSLIKFIKASNYEDFIEKRTREKIQEYRENWRQTYFLSGAIQIFSNPIGVFILSMVLYVGSKIGVASPDLIVFLISFQRLLPSYTSMQGIKNNLFVAYPGLEKVFELLRLSSAELEREGGRSLASFESLKMTNVGFGYGSDRRVLDHLNLSMEKGQMTALVGLSGQGKTTLVDVLIGFYGIDEGSYKINGQEIKELSLSSWRSKISYVTQDTFLFHDTIRNNIVFGQADVSDEELRKIIKICHAEFIYDLERGLDTFVGDRGSKLSGGQRQRIALVRALVRKPEILILDEATSSLDTESEMLIKNTLENLKQSRTVTIVLIAHRLETVKIADQILVINQGQVLEHGGWRELSQNPNSFFYKKLILNH